jgi:small subunit ribosomal protein S13
MKPEEKMAREERLVRILSTDIPGNKKVYIGLTRIKGVSFCFSNALCFVLGIDKNKKVTTLTEEEIKKISEFIKNPKDLPDYLLNRRKDIETGKTLHLTLNDLDMQKEFDIKRLKKIRSYRGLRHALGQPVRGQRTKSHFRKRDKKKAVGVQLKKVVSAPAKKPAVGAKK